MKLEKIQNLLESVLLKSFPNNVGKQKIYSGSNRLIISCPYCGDSDDPRKKRGNIYLDTLGYKCYNGGCGIFKDLTTFFKDYNVYDKLSISEKSDITEVRKTINITNQRRGVYGEIDIGLFFDSCIKDIIIPRSLFMEKLKLVDVDKSPIARYIRNRNQQLDSRFAWDPKKERLFLLNMIYDDKIIGLQVKNMSSLKGSSKYFTYKLSGIYQKLLYEKCPKIIERAKEIDPISSVFGIGSIDFGRDITVFEGPMDSWLWPNSVGLCSIENKFPFDTETRYWYDWDKAGIDKTVALLASGKTVFNWGKFLSENDINKNKKWDLNDIVNHLRKTGKKIKRFDTYFTNDALDLGWFVYN